MVLEGHERSWDLILSTGLTKAQQETRNLDILHVLADSLLVLHHFWYFFGMRFEVMTSESVQLL